MNSQDRKAAINAWKERKPAPAGIFSLTCAVDGAVWVGESRNLEAQQTGLFFALRHGGHPNRAAQAAFARHGAEAFAYAELERLSDDDTGPLQRAMLRERGAHWRARLNAASL